MLLAELPPAAVRAFVAAVGPDSGCALLSAEIRHLGGGMAPGVARATAAERGTPAPGASRASTRSTSVFGVGIAMPGAGEALAASLGRLLSRVEPWRAAVDYLNFAEHERPAERLFGDRRPPPARGEAGRRPHRRHPFEPPRGSVTGGVARAPAFIGWERATPLSRDLGEERMTVHYELPTTADFSALAGPHHPAITIYASTSPVVTERERAEVAVKSAFDEAIEQVKASGASNHELTELRNERDAIIGDQELWAGLARSLAIFVAPGFSEVFVLPNRLDDATHVGSHFTLGQLLRAPSQDQEAYAVAISANEWTLWHATPTDRAAQMPVDPTLPKNAVEAANREAGEAGTRRVGGHGDRGASEEDRRPATLDIYAKRVADAVRQELQARDLDERVPLFVFAAEPTLSQFMERAHNHRRIVAVQGAPDRLGPSEIDEVLRRPALLAQHQRGRDGTARPRRGKRRPGRTRPRGDRAARGRRRRRDAVVRLHHVGQRHARPRVGRDRVRDRQRRGRGAARRHPRGRRAAAARAARDGEGRQGRHGAQRRPRRDGVVGTRDGGTQVRTGLTVRRRMPRGGRVRPPSAGAPRVAAAHHAPGRRGW